MRLSLRSKMILYIYSPIALIFSVTVYINHAGLSQWDENVHNRMVSLANSSANNINSQLIQISTIVNDTARFVENMPSLNESQIYELLTTNTLSLPIIYGGALCYDAFHFNENIKAYCPYVHRGVEYLQSDFFVNKADVQSANVLQTPQENSPPLKRLNIGDEGYDYLNDPQWEWWHIPKSTGRPEWHFLNSKRLKYK